MVTSASLSVTRDGRVTPPRWGWAVRLSPALREIWWGRITTFTWIVFPLYRALLTDNIYCTGTIRTNRCSFPPDLKVMAKKGLAKRGDSVVRQDGNVSVTVWQDSRPTTFMSSGHCPDQTIG